MPRFSDMFRRLSESIDFDVDSWIARQPKPAVAFAQIIDVSVPPVNASVDEGKFYRVARNGEPKWALFQCPCGCGFVVTLSLQPTHRPRWRVRTSDDDRPTLRPSVWRDGGCFSHFFVDDGRVYWCLDSGSPPRLAHSRRG